MLSNRSWRLHKCAKVYFAYFFPVPGFRFASLRFLERVSNGYPAPNR
jgi:hypothetical protein